MDFEWLVANWHWLVGELGRRDVRVPSLVQLLVDASILNVVQFHLKGVTVTWANNELSVHENTSPLVLQIRESCEGA